MIAAVGALREDHIDGPSRAAMLSAFRGFRRADSPR